MPRPDFDVITLLWPSWTVQELRPEAEEKGFDLQLETDHAMAEADDGGIQIVIRNLAPMRSNIPTAPAA